MKQNRGNNEQNLEKTYKKLIEIWNRQQLVEDLLPPAPATTPASTSTCAPVHAPALTPPFTSTCAHAPAPATTPVSTATYAPAPTLAPTPAFTCSPPPAPTHAHTSTSTFVDAPPLDLFLTPAPTLAFTTASTPAFTSAPASTPAFTPASAATPTLTSTFSPVPYPDISSASVPIHVSSFAPAHVSTFASSSATVFEDIQISENEGSLGFVQSHLERLRRTELKYVYSRRATSRKRVAEAQDKLLILDINGLLADIVTTNDLRSGPVPYEPDSEFGERAGRRFVFLRPHLKEFLSFCFENFKVAIWTSRLRRNLDKFFTKYLNEYHFEFVWDGTRCTEIGFFKGQKRPVQLKDIKKVWEEFPEWNETNTLLIDDTPYKGSKNPEGTTIFPESFCYKDKNDDTSLGENGKLRVYLKELANATSVVGFVQNNRFGKPPLSKDDTFWKNVDAK